MFFWVLNVTATTALKFYEWQFSWELFLDESLSSMSEKFRGVY